MAISIFDLFSIGIGPSSSHTVGPMRAARKFVADLRESELWKSFSSVQAELYGSLALTGHGHGTDLAVLLGLSGFAPESTDPDEVPSVLKRIRREGQLLLLGEKESVFQEEKQLLFHMDRVLPHHSNGMRFSAYDQSGEPLQSRVFYSIGGGFIVDHEHAQSDDLGVNEGTEVPFPFKTCAELMAICKKEGLTIAEVMWKNELTWRSEKEIEEGLMELWDVMKKCVERGCRTEGELPGGLKVKRRAPGLLKALQESQKQNKQDPAEVMDWVSLWALAVNEENAAGGKVVTAPTNGAAGILPAVGHYYCKFVEGADDKGVREYLLTSAAVGILYKEGASISAAEVGCQGEVGVACSMAAAALAAVTGGSVDQVEQAAEIGMEHNLGLTCDPVGGLVQIPCIERNTMGAVKAINGARLALMGDGTHKVSLDQVIATMRQTGVDMQSIYKETSQGGLAVNVTEC